MAAGVNKLHLPLVAWPTHPLYHVVEGRAVTKEAPQPQNAILFAHTDPPTEGLGQGSLYPAHPWTWAGHWVRTSILLQL